MEIFIEIWPLARNNNLQIESVCSVCSVDFFSCLRQEILEEILFKILLRKKYFREIAILNRFLGRLGPQILHEDFLQDFLRKQHET